jgi:hypothetical protein
MLSYSTIRTGDIDINGDSGDAAHEGSFSRWPNPFTHTLASPYTRCHRRIASTAAVNVSCSGVSVAASISPSWKKVSQMSEVLGGVPLSVDWRPMTTCVECCVSRQDDAGKFARRLLWEMDSLWVFLAHHGVEPTNNRAEKALRCGVLWRKRSLGTGSPEGNCWVERSLSLKETCCLQAGTTYAVLMDAVSSLFHGQQPDPFWINVGVSTSSYHL